MEAGDVGQGVIAHAIHTGRLPDYALSTKTRSNGAPVRAFEMADFVAYEFRKVLEERRRSRWFWRRRRRRSFMKLYECLPTKAIYLDMKTLERVYRKRPDLFVPAS